MVPEKHSFGRLLLLFVAALLATALMVQLSPPENSWAAFVLWSFFFAGLLAPREICRKPVMRFRPPRPTRG